MPQEHISSRETHLPPGWTAPKPEVLAAPTWWPALLALGATFVAWGLVTSFLVLILGLLTFAVSLAGWIKDIRHEHNHH